MANEIPKLIIISGPNAGLEFPLDRDITKIGRSNENEIIINDKVASRVHAEITNLDGECYIQDLQSRNGTQLNNADVNEARLYNNDEIKIGKTIFRFVDTSKKGVDEFQLYPEEEDDEWGDFEKPPPKKSVFSTDDAESIFTVKNIILAIVIVFIIVFVLYLSKLANQKVVVENKPLSLEENGNLPWGNIWGADRNHADKVIFTFKTPPYDQVELEYKVWDIDKDGEVKVYVNGEYVLGVEKTGDGEWSSMRTFPIDKELFLQDQDNTLVFDNILPRDFWGVADVSFIQAKTFICDMDRGNEAYILGRDKWESRHIVKKNLYEAIQLLEKAINLSKNCPVAPEFYVEATALREKAKETLDTIVNDLFFEISKAQRLHNYKQVQAVCIEITRIVPDTSHEYYIKAQNLYKAAQQKMGDL